mgnify:FL=1
MCDVSNETWEYTIVRDYWRNVGERGSLLIALGTEKRFPSTAATAGGKKGQLWRPEDEQIELLVAGVKAMEQVCCA